MTLWFSDSPWKINFPLFVEAMIKFQQFAIMRKRVTNWKKSGKTSRNRIFDGGKLLKK